MEKVRIGCVKYLNTLPLIEGLGRWAQSGEAELISAVPAKLVGMLVGGEADVALVSLIDAARAERELTLLDVGMIGCDGPTLTVRLFSTVPFERVRRVYADTDSHTSVALMNVVMHRRYGRTVDVIDFDARERVAVGPGAAREDAHAGDWPATVLLIGDKVVTDAPPADRYPHTLDLGEAWKDLTGLPFVYAAWMCRRGEEESIGVRTAAAMLDRARRHNATRLDWLVARRAAERGWPADLAATYVGSSLRYDLGEVERFAAEKFIGEAADLGLAPARELNWSLLESH